MIDRFIEMCDAIGETEDALKTMKAERDELEQELRASFEKAGIANVKTADGRTVFVHRQLWARAKDGDKVAVTSALETVGLGEFVTQTFNTNQVSAYVREQDKLGTELPPELESVLDIAEVFSVRVRKS